MHVYANSFAALTCSFMRARRLLAALLLFLCVSLQAHAAATLLLEEPYSYDGAFSGTGHSAVYLNHVCADSPVVLRACAPGETGVVLSRYNGVAGYDWIAVPLLPYLYAVDRSNSVPLFADAKLVAFLRDQYRRAHLESLAPDRPDGSTPEGNWYELVGASYDRTIYGFEIETTPAQDGMLIAKFNGERNRQRYNFMKRNCADFVREVINFYYPHALHRDVVVDLGVTTPKQLAKVMVKYTHHHPELQSRNFVVPQLPGTIQRSKPIHGVVESVAAAKKYMLPLFFLHPYVAGSLVAGYFGYERFDPTKHALVLDADRQLDTPITSAHRRIYQSRLDELTRSGPSVASMPIEKDWEHFRASAAPAFDGSGSPVEQMWVGKQLVQVGISRANFLSTTDSSEISAGLLKARLHQELRPAIARKTAPPDIESDLGLLRQLLSVRVTSLTGATDSPESAQVSANSNQ